MQLFRLIIQKNNPMYLTTNDKKTRPFQFPEVPRSNVFNPLRPKSDLSQTSHCNIKGLSVSEVMRIDNMITQIEFY